MFLKWPWKLQELREVVGGCKPAGNTLQQQSRQNSTEVKPQHPEITTAAPMSARQPDYSLPKNHDGQQCQCAGVKKTSTESFQSSQTQLQLTNTQELQRLLATRWVVQPQTTPRFPSACIIHKQQHWKYTALSHCMNYRQQQGLHDFHQHLWDLQHRECWVWIHQILLWPRKAKEVTPIAQTEPFTHGRSVQVNTLKASCFLSLLRKSKRRKMWQKQARNRRAPHRSAEEEGEVRVTSQLLSLSPGSVTSKPVAGRKRIAFSPREGHVVQQNLTPDTAAVCKQLQHISCWQPLKPWLHRAGLPTCLRNNIWSCNFTFLASYKAVFQSAGFSSHRIYSHKSLQLLLWKNMFH